MGIQVGSIPPIKQIGELIEYAKKADEQTKEMIKLTKAIKILTWVMIGLVVIQVVLTISNKIL